ncbi:MAG: hypothetical protein DMG50_09165 [Acidobacteria bacterium]|nr:MAG: hypothetical protein DMG50_09165 [Acidobacteriota bacterium]
MRSVLTGAENPINALRGRIVAADDLVRLCGEVELAAGERQTMRGAQCPEIDRRQRLSGCEIDDGDGVERTVGTAVVRNVGQLAIRGCHDFMGIRPGGHARHNLQVHRINNGQRIVALLQYEQRWRRCLRRRKIRAQQQNPQHRRAPNRSSP